MAERRVTWSFSFAKLMQSCSRELVVYTSKPKMSTTPMMRLSLLSWAPAVARRALMVFMSRSKRRENMARESASRKSLACVYLMSASTHLEPALTVRFVSTRSRLPASSLRTASTSASSGIPSAATLAASERLPGTGSNCTLPRIRIAAMQAHQSAWAASLIPWWDSAALMSFKPAVSFGSGCR